MKILSIGGDKSFAPGHPRFELQHASVERLEVVYWGKGSLLPSIPAGPFDVITVQDPFWRGLYALYLSRRLGVALQVQVHTSLSAQSLLRHVVAQIVLRHAHSVRVVSQKIKTEVERMGISAPIHVLPIYLDVEKFRAVERRPSGSQVILWIGRFEEEKNPLLALEVFEKVRDTFSEARLIMLGQGSLRKELHTRAEHLQIEFPGWVPSIIHYLESADVVLSTSYHESWGASIIEALASGVPVVAPDVGVAREAGAVVVPRAELAEAVITVLRERTRGELKLILLSREEWIAKWKETLQ